MARPSKLSPEQWAEVDRRLAAGEGVRALAKAFDVSPATISKRGVAKQSEQVRSVAKQVADAQAALAELPVAQQYVAMGLAEKLRNISVSLASAAEHGAATAHRLNALANSEVGKVDDAAPLSPESIAALKGVGVLTKLANDSAHIAVNLLAANKERIQRLDDQPPADAPQTSGVLMVPGLMTDSASWAQAAQAATKGGG
jgi:hypothetical protein